MSKKYIYRPEDWMNDQYVVKEFFSMMDTLAAVHKSPVRLVKTKNVLGYHFAVYELCDNKAEQKQTK